MNLLQKLGVLGFKQRNRTSRKYILRDYCKKLTQSSGLSWQAGNPYIEQAVRKEGCNAWAWVGTSTVQFSSVAQSCPTLCDPSTPGLPVHHQPLESTQTHVHQVSDVIQPSHPLSSPSPPALNLFQHQGLFKWVSSSHQVAKILEFQVRHQSFQWTPRTDLY